MLNPSNINYWVLLKIPLSSAEFLVSIVVSAGRASLPHEGFVHCVSQNLTVNVEFTVDF